MRRVQQQQKEEVPAPEEGVLPHAIHLQATAPVDAALPVGLQKSPIIVPSRLRAPLLCTPRSAHLGSTAFPTLQGVPSRGVRLLAWHPTRQRLLTASTAAVVEYDTVSGARRNLVEVTGTPLRLSYTPSGSAVVLLTKVGACCGRQHPNP